MRPSDGCRHARTCYRAQTCDGPRGCEQAALVRDVERRNPPGSVPDGWKWCPGCGQVLPLPDYRRNRRFDDGHSPVCRECERRREAIRREAHARGEGDLRRRGQDGIPEGQKRCARCRKVFPADLKHFGPSGYTKDGLVCYCRKCKRRYASEWRRRNA